MRHTGIHNRYYCHPIISVWYKESLDSVRSGHWREESDLININEITTANTAIPATRKRTPC